MYKIGYEVRLEDTASGFIISSYDCGNSRARDDIKTCPAIKMTVEDCKSKEVIASYYGAAYPLAEIEELSKDFREHFQQILDCRYEGWKLVTISVMPAELHLEYYCLLTEESITVSLDITRSRIRKLTLNLEVPTPDSSSAASYQMWLEANAVGDDGNGKIDASTLIEAEYPHLRQRRIFMLSTLDPYRLSITDIYDL